MHDLYHPGQNNAYQINSISKHALRYNDKSVLENFHLYESFKLLNNPKSNILCKLQKEENRIFRKRMIECILATDMTNHFKVLAILKSKVENIKKQTNESIITLIINQGENAILKFDIQQDILNFLIHTADISNPAKEFVICKQWASLCMEEFFRQGDLEKAESLPVSFLCDRGETVNIPKAQIGFIKGIVSPIINLLVDIIPELTYFQKNIDKNLEEWENY